jgi:hypothetical protein
LSTLRIVAIAAAALGVLSGPATAQSYDCSEPTYQRVRPKIVVLFGAGILQNDPNGGVSVLVADRYWSSLTFPQKKDFADALVCAIAGAHKGLSGLTLKSLQSGKVIGEWAAATLTIP